MAQVPFDSSTLVVVDVRALEKPGQSTLRPQGWSVLPLFTGDQARPAPPRHAAPRRTASTAVRSPLRPDPSPPPRLSTGLGAGPKGMPPPPPPSLRVCVADRGRPPPLAPLAPQVNSGVFELPLYAGPPPLPLLQQLSRRGPEVLEAAIKKKQLKYVEWGSITIGVLDAQRFGEWDATQARPEPNVSLLPPKPATSWYRKPPTSKEISTLVPADSNREEFLNKSVAAFAEGVKNMGGSS